MRPQLDRETEAIFQRAMDVLEAAHVPFVVGGAFALNHYTGIWRYTKDFDVFCRRAHAHPALDALARAGFRTHVEERHWLGKALVGEALVDVIWGGGNWATFVDDHWFDRAERGEILGRHVLVAPPEDIIVSKAWVAGRERFDGADICHILRAQGHRIDWDYLVSRFGDHWPLLLQYLILYRFVYSEARDLVPVRLIHELAQRIGTDAEVRDGLEFRGPLLDRYSYLHDIEAEGRPDPRETIADRAGYPIEDVHLRRRLDTEAYEDGRPYRQQCEDKEEPPHWPPHWPTGRAPAR